MIDFYWLKSFTEIVQLFICGFFILYLFRKYPPLNLPLKWFIGFLAIKFISDIYGVLNYTQWIVEIFTRPVMNLYRMMMGPLELSMMACFFVFSRFVTQAKYSKRSLRQNWLFFLPAILIIPLNYILKTQFNNNLTEMFLIVRMIFIIALVYLIIQQKKEIGHRQFMFALLAWNVLWFLEVFLHQFLGLISEATSWIIFVISELLLTVGLTRYLIHVIANPRVFRFDIHSDEFSEAFTQTIQTRLNQVLKAEKRYKDSGMTVSRLADHLQISTGDLTTYLNRNLGMNFNQYLTQHRISESIRLLESRTKREMTIEQIMYEAGFNSKSVFNTAFKKKTGKTPSAYRKDHAQNIQQNSI